MRPLPSLSPRPRPPQPPPSLSPTGRSPVAHWRREGPEGRPSAASCRRRRQPTARRLPRCRPAAASLPRVRPQLQHTPRPPKGSMVGAARSRARTSVETILPARPQPTSPRVRTHWTRAATEVATHGVVPPGSRCCRSDAYSSASGGCPGWRRLGAAAPRPHPSPLVAPAQQATALLPRAVWPRPGMGRPKLPMPQEHWRQGWQRK
mmetsp:Transcript_46862/g.125315  ORF Transcript_46862/g.125315 Transcript_46862/m.125315 type:complete len:206 (-) Transcript_46862:252-869(-)